MSSLLEIKNLKAGYQTTEQEIYAVRDVSLELNKGEFLGIAGESGCGKSTLAYAITGLLEHPGKITGGQVLLQGEDLIKKTPAELRQMRWQDFSLVMQASMNVLNPVMPIREQFYDTMAVHHPKDDARYFEERAQELLALVNISPKYLEAYPHQLSGGMKQRVVIALALALQPSLVIMDEPVTALDVVVQRGILQQIDQLRQKLDFSIIFITHDLSLLVEIADSIAIMYAGQVVEKAKAIELYQNPFHPYTEALMQSFPPLLGQRKRRHGIAGHPPNLAIVRPGCPFFERCPKGMAGICDVKNPELKEVDSEHYVACQLYPEGNENTV